MKFVGLLSGNAPTILKFQAGATFGFAGVPACVAGSSGYGLQKATTIAAVSCLGITLDIATPQTAQQSDGSDPSRLLSVIINPDALYRAKVSGGATENTALAEGTEDTGSTTGLLVSTNIDYSSPSYDEGTMLGSYGANAGVYRKITSLSTADAVPSVAFTNDIAIGDKFIALPWSFMDLQYVQLTTNLFQVNGAVTIDTDNVNFIPQKLILPADINDYPSNIAIDMMIWDSVYSAGKQ